jgi:pyruvate/2-oxoglutarate dehydrogenase complex dihydrolipoamide dehydrogenase (E3) component
MNTEEFDLVILGSGVGTKVAAWTFGGQGKRVAVVERKYIGGSCPNIACLPSKNIIHSAKIASYVLHGNEFGIKTTGFEIDMPAVRARKRAMVSDLVDLHSAAFKHSGSELIMGSGRFIGPRTLEVSVNDGTMRVLRGTNVIVGTGSRATIDPVPGLMASQPLTHIEALELEVVPEHLIVIGGGYVGLELSQAMRRFGSKVTILEHASRLVHQEDDDVTEGLLEALTAEGIDILSNVRLKTISGKSGDHVRVTFQHDGLEKTIEGSHILVATGRAPNTEGIGLDLAGVELTPTGYIKVNERLQTTAPGVWAVGDVTGGPKFTHIGYDDFRVVYDNITGKHHVTTGRQVPFCLYTDPEVARVGLSEKDAQAQGVVYRLFKFPVAEILRARTLSETRGFFKALVATDSDQILGFTAFGVEAGEVMSAVQIAMIAKLPYTALRDAVLTHPTMTEGLNSLFASAATNPKSTSAGV